jgi:hypothetical protein
VVEGRLCLALKLRNNPLGQNLAQFHAPLVERVDVPDGTLGEDAVLVLDGLVGNAILRVIQEQTHPLGRHPLAALGIVGEQISQM